MPAEGKRLTYKKKKRGSAQLKGTTKYPREQKHNPRQNGEGIYCAYCCV